MRIVNLNAWEVLGRWQITVTLKDVDEFGNLDESADRSASTTLPDVHDASDQCVIVLDSASQMLRSLGLRTITERLAVPSGDGQGESEQH